MNIQLNIYEVEMLEYILDKFIFQQQEKNLYYALYLHIQTMIKMQRENHLERLIYELKAQSKRGETPSIAALQRQEGIGYARAAKLIEDARAEVAWENRIEQARKEQK